ncbi:MAG: hypothetical protein KJO31_04770 [Gammaproteobacteria bacterium]|nr:hypothetical protein [Gammaproteobacteria bacterium]
MFGLTRKKRRRSLEDFPPTDPETLLDSQSLRGAIVGAVVAVIVFNYAWILSADLFGKVFPWLSMLQGVIVGQMVRRMGHGFDWRFPVIAAIAAYVGSISANFIIAAMTTGADLGVGTMEVLGSVTTMTFGVFFTETFNVVDQIYAATAAAIAAFFARRILNRREVLELRKYQEAKRV